MIECQSCHTLNPDAEKACLACGAALPVPGAPTGVTTMGMARCPAGHPIDPSWKSCPYCERLQAPGGAPSPERSTRLEGEAATSSTLRATRLEEVPSPHGADWRTRLEGEGEGLPPPPALPIGSPKPTRLEEPDPPVNDRRTVLQESPPSQESSGLAQRDSEPRHPAPAASAGVASRRLVAVLAAPALGPGGTVFPVRAGKNVIGSDRMSEVLLAADPEVSREHAVILHRNGTFHLADRLSTNGTWVNGREVPANGTVPLSDRDRIRCGKTELVFLVIDPGGDSPARMGDEDINV